MVQEKLGLWLFPQNPVLDLELVVAELDLLNTLDAQRFEIAPELSLRIVPEHDPKTLKHLGKGLGDLIHVLFPRQQSFSTSR